MITERELLQAIDECQSEPLTSTKIGKLADLFTVYNYLFGEKEPRTATTERTVEKVISERGDSDFMRKIDGMKSDNVWRVIDELMQTIEVINPRLYDGVMRKLDQ